jgi:hypothetical protein
MARREAAQPWLGSGVPMGVTRLTVVIATVFLALLAAAPSADAKRRVPHGFFGAMWDGSVVNADDGVQDEQWGLMSRTGVESVRAVFSWSDAQPSADSPPSFERTDELVTLAVEHGMRLLPVVIETPPWARAYNHRFSPPRHPGDFAAYLRALVGRYGPRGSFWSEHTLLPKRPIRVFQLWNEPHLSYRWYAKSGSKYAWPRGYLRLLKVAHGALKKADRRAKIVLAGLTGDSWNRLLALYRRHARPYFDIAAIQTYTGSPKLALRAIYLFRRAMRRYGDARKPIWATETGWPAAHRRMRVPRGQRTLVSTDRGMASRLGKMFRLLAANRRLARYRVGRVFWYTWSSPYRPLTDIFDFAGLESYYRGTFERKPALRAYRRTVRRYEGCGKNSFGACR